jgi:hypothetical protein
LSDELDPESGAETATEAALLARRPRSGREYESALADTRPHLDELVALGQLSEADAAAEAEVLLDISWLAAEGHISVDAMIARTQRLAERCIARMRARGGRS